MTTPPTLHYASGTTTIWHGEALDVLRSMNDNTLDSIVTDPPYGLSATDQKHIVEALTRWLGGDREFIPDAGKGFMGNRWDTFVPPPAVWDEALRVLKPGGHLLAFAGSRTFDLMGLSIRLAGFDIRDGLMWLYGSGFPKSLDVTDAMNRYMAEGPQSMESGIRPGVYDVTGFLRAARDRAGWSNRKIDALFGTNGMSGHWTSSTSQPAVPSVRQWAELKKALGFDDSMDDLVERLGSEERPEDWGTREQDAGFLTTLGKNGGEPVGAWGTALKPAYEPIVVARKPIRGSVAANILTHGTGALHLDAVRVPMSEADREKYARGSEAFVRMSEDRGETRADGSTRKSASIYGEYGNAVNTEANAAGRFPPNVILDGHAADELDAQTRTTNDAGASRYFPVFRCEPKAPTKERPRVGTGTSHGIGQNQRVCAECGARALSGKCTCENPTWLRGELENSDVVEHPTVKPLDLMRWLVRLVTPIGGKTGDFFLGSGTTAEAAVVEGFEFVGCERERKYLPLIGHRLARGDVAGAVEAQLDPNAPAPTSGGLF